MQDEPRGADTVLVNERRLRCSINDLQNVYSIDRDPEMRQIVVEPMIFVQNCLRRQEFVHVLQRRQAMGGYVGRQRTEFSTEDDDNLCWYISRKIPYADHGGRLSYGIWKELMSAAVHDSSLEWARRHTIESWRERYRKRREHFDPIIDRYVRKAPPEPSAWYGLSRKYNKNSGKVLILERDDGIVELTDGSASESEEELDVGVKPKRRGRPPEKDTNLSKRRRVSSLSNSSPAPVVTHKTTARLQTSSPGRSQAEDSPEKKSKGKEVDRGTSEPDQDHRGSFDISPGPEHFEPVISQPRQPTHSPAMTRQADLYSTPAPSPTLVQRASSAIRSPQFPPSPSTRRVNLPVPPSPHPSTSFRNVVHSSPVFAGTGSPSRSGIRSHNTSATEPSSRSMVVPSELTRPSANATNAPAESSITRESSHKPSSPLSLPMKKASRKLPSRRLPVRSPSDEDEEEGETQGIQWAPYKNTRSRSRSVEPTSLPSLDRKQRRKNGKGREVSRKEQPLEPVHESQVEQEQDVEMSENQIISNVSETIQDEQKVAHLLMVNSNEPVSGTFSGMSARHVEESGNEVSVSEGETEEEGEEIKRSVRREKQEEEEETQEARGSAEADSADEDETAKFETAPTGVVEMNEPEIRDGDDDDIHDISSFSESEGAPSPKDEDSTLDISSDDEATEQQFLSGTRSKGPESRRRRQLPLSSDDEEVNQTIESPTTQNTPTKTAKEVLELFDSSPGVGGSQPSPEVGKPQQKQQQQSWKLFNNVRAASPSPLQSQNQNRPRESLPVSRPTRGNHTPTRPRASLPPARTPAQATPVNQAIQKQTGPHRVSFGGGSGDDGHLLSPSSVGSLPQTPFTVNPQSVQRGSSSRAHSSLRHTVPLSHPRSAQPQSRSRSRRRGSADSTSSELQATFPITGTRASAVKQQMEQALKESPYTPPSGTKAARALAAVTAKESRLK